MDGEVRIAKSHLQTQDRIYFRSIFGSKIFEIELEIQRLKHEIDSRNVLSKTAKDLSEQTEDLRNELEDYNMARMNSFCDVKQLKKEVDDLHAHNEHVQLIIEELYLEKQRKEERIQQLENGKSNDLESQLNTIRKGTSGSPIQQEALSLIDQIVELESKYDELIEEDDDNENPEEYLNEIQKIQQTNLTLLTSISQTLLTANVPQTSLTEQYRKLKQEFNRLETLDRRLIDELHELKIKYTKMQEDIAKFNDLEGLKHQTERRKQRLTLDKINMIKQRQITQIEIQTLQSQFETLQTQLCDDQTHQQLVHLEQKLQNVSQALFSLDEIPTSYEPIKHQALALVHAHNQWLIHRLKPSS